MKRDKARFRFRHLDSGFLKNIIVRVLSDPKLLRIEMLDFPEQRIRENFSFFDPFHRENDVVCKRQINDFVKFSAENRLGILDNHIRELKILRCNLSQQLRESAPLYPVMHRKGFFDFGFIDRLARLHLESDPFSDEDQFLLSVVFDENDVIVHYFFDDHHVSMPAARCGLYLY